jgi:hypothetical protein
MAINSTEVAYNFGQMGSIHVSTTDAVTSNEVTVDPGVGANAVFVAITFLEDTTFHDSLAGLTPATAQLYIGGTGSESTSIDADGGSITGTETFPEGVTIYGRWTGFKLATGRVIAYIGY